MITFDKDKIEEYSEKIFETATLSGEMVPLILNGDLKVGHEFRMSIYDKLTIEELDQLDEKAKQQQEQYDSIVTKGANHLMSYEEKELHDFLRKHREFKDIIIKVE